MRGQCRGIGAVLRGAAVISSAVVVAGCGGSGEVARLTALTRVITDAQQTMGRADWARGTLVAECMAERGFTYEPEPADYESDLPVEVLAVGLTEDEAAARGYERYRDVVGIFRATLVPAHVVIDADGSPQFSVPDEWAAEGTADERNDEFVDSLTLAQRSRYAEALDGGSAAETVVFESGVSIAVGGCSGEAMRRVLGEDVASALTAFDQVRLLVPERYGEDAELVRARSAWQGCMVDAGFQVGGPGDAVLAGVVDTDWWGQPSDGQIALAVADASCRAETGIDRAVAVAVVQARYGTPADQQRVLRDWVSVQARILDNVDDVFGVPPSDSSAATALLPRLGSELDGPLRPAPGD